MYKFYFIILLLLYTSCNSKLSYQKLAYELIIETIVSNPIDKYKSDFLNIYQPYSDSFFSPSQSDHYLNEDHVVLVTLNSDDHYHFRSTFLNDTCVSVSFFFFDKIDTTILLSIKNVIVKKYGIAKKSHKNETGGHLSFKANINVYDWNLNGNRLTLEYDVDSTNLNFIIENVTQNKRAERVVLTKLPAIRPQLIKKPNIVIPDSIKNKFPNSMFRSIYEIEIDTSGRICNYRFAFGDTLFNEFTIHRFDDYLFKPAVNKYGEPILSKLIIPIIIDFRIDTAKIRK